MKLAAAFLKLIRWPNLFFIVLTQCLFFFCIILSTYQGHALQHAWFLTWNSFGWITISSVLIAAAGYIINDYFDLAIDQVNKPAAIIVQKIIKRRWAIFWHMSLSVLAIMITFFVAWQIGNWVIGPANIAAVFLLLFYSTTFKKKFLIGNIIISLLTAWVVFVLYIAELDLVTFTREQAYQQAMTRIFKLAVLYGGFAFIISLVREVIKDMEDIKGDEKFGCRTMPVVWGIPASKVFAGVWLVVLITAVLILFVYAILIGWWWAAAFVLLLVVLPLVRILRRLYSAVTMADFHAISSWIKWVMLSGIISMVFFKWHI
ncbi:MAG TPA: geranylgeranylglycerol-phosphate geranylgeranyltransferase [Chitinophagaceae bacterium]|nr:geranylgeranylglycerol-phosphate geranylgeranyltransferase [Chitinophagaceae bacterium]